MYYPFDIARDSGSLTQKCVTVAVAVFVLRVRCGRCSGYLVGILQKKPTSGPSKSFVYFKGQNADKEIFLRANTMMTFKGKVQTR